MDRPAVKTHQREYSHRTPFFSVSGIINLNQSTLEPPSLCNRQGDIAKEQSKLLYDEFNNDDTTARGVEFIKNMVVGNSPHSVEGLKQALREGILGGVPVRCTSRSCVQHNNTTARRLVGFSKVYCVCNFGRLECAACKTPLEDSKDIRCRGPCKRLYR